MWDDSILELKTITHEDYVLLSSIYIDLISDRQCFLLYDMLCHLNETFIEGTMPYGEHFWYTHEKKLDDYMWEELKGKDKKDGVLTILTVFFCKALLKEEGIK